MVSVVDKRDNKTIERLRLTISGIVQGVGFRPFVYRTANRLFLTGWVRNSSAGVLLEIQGTVAALSAFTEELHSNAPPLSSITSVTTKHLPVLAEETDFTIMASTKGEPAIQIAPDTAICPDCLKELLDPADRRYLYPFINCTNCGPRYSIIKSAPYDRQYTTMADFQQCPDCLTEYLDPNNRRFHAQPNACPVCGPQISLLASSQLSTSPILPLLGKEKISSPRRGEVGRGEDGSNASCLYLAEGDAAILQTVRLLQEGNIIAIKGIGGYHLAVDACNHQAVTRLRKRKKRDEKPLAVMAANLETARDLACLNKMEEKLLTSPESPVVIVRKSINCPVSPLVAPDNGWLGLMLPYAPLHHLLFREPGTGNREQKSQKHLPIASPESRVADLPFPALVMTSANISDEPIVYEDADAIQRLGGIADFFLVHNRQIHIRSDDSVIRVFQEKPLFYRRARGYAPRPVKLPFQLAPILATGAEMKGAICLVNGEQAFLSQHLGDLQNSSTNDSFRHCIQHLSNLLQIIPETVACDLHPDYSSSLYAEESGLPLIAVQHHHAHLASCMAENGLTGEVVGIILDGTGFGNDGTIWGGEFLVGGYDGFKRAAHFRQTRLPGGDAAVREPWRMAVSYLYQLMGDQTFEFEHPVIKRMNKMEASLLKSMLQKGINSPLTSSCGRLFDAVAALLGIRHFVSYDGQAAIELEALAELSDDETEYSFDICSVFPPPFQGESRGGDGVICEFSTNTQEPPHPHPNLSLEGKGTLKLDFSQTIAAILADQSSGVSNTIIARRFHNTVAEAAAGMCFKIAADTCLDRVILSGGVFQNRLLSELVYNILSSKQLQVFTHRLVPPNDGGIALGQAAIAGRRIN